MRGQRLQLSFLRFKILFLLVFWLSSGISQNTLTVINEDNEPLVGVAVYTDDYSYSAITNVFGHVKLDDLDNDQVINMKYLGYEEVRSSLQTLSENDWVQQLNPLSEILEEVIFIGRSETAQNELPYKIDQINKRDISATHSQNPADALAHHSDVFVQKSQMGGGSPVIRGFEANKVLLVIDGVRLNNAIYRNGHLQNAITVDQAMLDRIELIYGPNSLMYGSDALGGVVHFLTRKPKFNYSNQTNTRTEGNYGVRYSSANEEKSGHVDFNIGTRNFASLTSFSFADYGDLRAGNNRSSDYPDFGKRLDYVKTENNEDVLVINDNPNKQIGTGYSQFDFLQKFLFQTKNELQFGLNFQYSTSSDVPRYDQLTEQTSSGLKFAEWYYGPQTRFLSSFHVDYYVENSFFDKLKLITAYQFIEEDRIDRRFNSSFRSHQEEDVHIGSLTADFKKALGQNDRVKLQYGMDISHNQVNSNAFDEQISSGAIETNVFTRYPSDGSNLSLYGMFINSTFQNSDSTLVFNAGLRYSGSHWEIKYSNNDPILWPSEFISGLSSSNSALTWSVGSTFKPDRNWSFRILGSSAFRSPNIDDLAKIRIKGGEITVPNPNLEPEKSINAEATIERKFTTKVENKPIKLATTGFYTSLSDAIIREAFSLPGGIDYLIDEGDTLRTVANVNAQKAYIWGISANIEAPIIEKLKLKASINYIKGRVNEDTGQDTPLSHIPPVYGKIDLNYELGDWSILGSLRYNFKKPIAEYGGSEDNPEKATPEGALSWSTLNLYVDRALNKQLNLQFGVENILDRHYRPFSSGVSAAGINAIISISGSF